MSSVLKVYQDVIEDVITAVREMFLEDGVDEQVLQELKLSWEAKLLASKAVENTNEIEKQGLIKKEISSENGFTKPQAHHIAKQVVGQVAPNNHVQTQAVAQAAEAKLVPIQITLPAQPGSGVPSRVLTIHVPASALQDNQLHKVLTGPVITATMNLPSAIASTVLQHHVNTAFSHLNQAASAIAPAIALSAATTTKSVIQNDGAHDCDADMALAPSCSSTGTNNLKLPKLREWKLTQNDGPGDTSDEDDDGTDDEEASDENDDDKDDDEQEMDEGGPEEEPLNSEDDVTDEDPLDLFDTENVVVCQYDKITRSRNKWKFHLKDGIMNLNGADYVFQKASGDAEW